MKKLLIGLGFSLALLLCSANSSFAQAPTKICVPNANGGCQDVSVAYPFPVNATATIGGFMWNGGSGTLTSTASSSASTAIPAATGSLAATTALRITNNGTSEISCTFATGAATAVINNIQVPVGSSVVRQIGAFDHLACINQAGDAASNVAVLESGTGLGNDSGGGSSGGGSSSNASVSATGSAVPASATYIAINAGGTLTGWTGAVTNAGTFAVQATLQASATTAIGKVDPNTIATWGLQAPGSAAPTNGQMVGGSDGTDFRALLTNASGNLLPISKIWDGTNTAAVKAASTAAAQTDTALVERNPDVGTIGDTAWTSGNGTAIAILKAIAGGVLGAIPAGPNVIGFTSNDACSQAAKLGAPINLTASGQLITGTSAKKTYICSLDLISATAQNIALVEGTGSTCATNIYGLAGGTTAATGWNLPANGGLTKGSGAGTVYSPSGDTNATAANVCLLSSSTGQISGQITYVQQ